MNVLSLFDGMSCGRIALDRAGVEVETYYASELDKYAIKVTQANWPETVQLGDVTKWREWDIDWSAVDLFIVGSPCQGFSFAGKQAGTKATVDGADVIITTREEYLDAKEKGALFHSQSYLFWEYVLCLDHVKEHNPKVKYMLENVKMKKELLDMISDAIDCEPIFINSALVSAQNSQRYYWSNLQIDEPLDRGIVLKDIIQTELTSCNVGLAVRDKSKCIMVGGRGSPFGSKQEWDSPYVKCDKKLKVKHNQGKASCLTGGANSGGNHSDMDILVMQVARGNNPGGARALDGKTPSMTSSSWQYNNHLLSNDIVRRFSVTECERLQTVPDGYTQNKGVSNSQAYKMLGNGWTVDVIAHIFSSLTHPNS